jgi:hypothetical protein
MNEKISKLAGLFTQVASEITNSDMSRGEQFLLLQRLMADIKPATQAFDKIKKKIETSAKQIIVCNGEKQSEEIELDGASVLIKYSYPADKLDEVKLEKALQDAYSELNAEYDQSMFTKPQTVRQTVIIQSIVDR